MISLQWTPRLCSSSRTPSGSRFCMLGSAFHGFLWQARPVYSGPPLACPSGKPAAEPFRPLLCHQSPPFQRGSGKICPNSGALHNQFCVAALPLSLVRNGRQKIISSAYGSDFKNVAHSQYSSQAQKMARRSSARNKVAHSQQKSQLQGVSNEQSDDEGPDLQHRKDSLSAQDQPNDVVISKQIQLKTRLAAFQKAGNLTALTVAELKGIMRMWNRPTAGKKQELLEELKTILADPKSWLPGDIGEGDQAPLSKNTAEVDNEAPLIAGSRKRGRANTKTTGVQEESAGTITTAGKEPVSTVKVYRSRRAKATKTDAVPDADGGKMELAVTKAVQVKEVWATFNHKKPEPEWYAYDPTTMRPLPPSDRGQFHKLISWNVNGIRALLKGKDPKTHDAVIFKELAEREDFDILCLQETKLQEKDVDKVKDCLLPDYLGSYWSCSTAKLGYSGTAIISRVEPRSVTYGLGSTDHDKEGRVITAEYESFFLVTSYVPNSGDGLKRLDYRITEWDPALSNHVKKLEEKKPVILTGDLNCCHQEMDIADPNGNRRSAGFTNEERASFEESYLKKGMVDTFRRQHPNAVGYTYWGYRTGARARNHGWRLDYFLASQSLTDRLHDSFSLPHIQGSDHCPIGLIITR